MALLWPFSVSRLAQVLGRAPGERGLRITPALPSGRSGTFGEYIALATMYAQPL